MTPRRWWSPALAGPTGVRRPVGVSVSAGGEGRDLSAPAPVGVQALGGIALLMMVASTRAMGWFGSSCALLIPILLPNQKP